MNSLNQLYISVLLTGIIINSSVSCRHNDNDGPPPDTTAPAITFTAPVNTTITGDRAQNVTVTGTLSETSTLAVTFNGAPVDYMQPGGSTSFEIIVNNFIDRDNVLSVTATDGAGNAATGILTLDYPYLRFDNGQAALAVIGQPDFISNLANQGGGPGAGTLNVPWGDAVVDENGRIYIVDFLNSRVLRFASLSDVSTTSNNISEAEFVIGQDSLDIVVSDTTSNKFRKPVSIFINSGKLFLVDEDNRVLIWNSIPNELPTPSADIILGQIDSTSIISDCTSSNFNTPEKVFVVSNKMIVSDTYNHRVLIWESIPVAGNENLPSLVLGQSDFDHCNPNDENYLIPDDDGIASAVTMNEPWGIWSDGEKLYIADAGNNRILVWDTFPTENRQEPVRIIGQGSNTTNDPSFGFNYPSSITSNGNQLFICSSADFKIAILNSLSISGVVAPNNFLGADQGLSDTQFGSVEGVSIIGRNLLVADGANHRIMVFQSQPAQ